MTKQLVEEYSRLKAAEDDIKLKRAAAVARQEDAAAGLATAISEIQGLGFQTVAELQLAIAEAEGELKVLLEAAQAKLEEGGYA